MAREHGHDAAELAKIGEPAGDGVLLRGIAREEGGDGGSGGGRKDRGHRADEVLRQRSFGGRTLEVVRAQAVDDQERDIGRRQQVASVQEAQWRIRRVPAACPQNRAHQVNDAAAVVIRTFHGCAFCHNRHASSGVECALGGRQACRVRLGDCRKI
jgi:hypothetical protein